jgi:hypothetical protein
VFHKECKTCGCAFTATGPAGKYCPSCWTAGEDDRKRKNRAATAAWCARNGKIKKPGSGKGGNVAKGSDNPHYKHGWYIADRLRPQIKARGYCERCTKDLREVNRWMWVVHHRDHNHANNVIENLELLCKRCHQIEHECHTAFTKGATTIPEGSRP